MIKSNILETIIGGVVLLVALYFALLAYDNVGVCIEDGDRYIISAGFENADGVDVGSAVKIAGITVGRVAKTSLNTNYSAMVDMYIDQEIKLPMDSSAEILSDGILGSKYISLSPGNDSEFLTQGDSIGYTQSAIIIENLIKKFIFGSTDSKTAD